MRRLLSSSCCQILLIAGATTLVAASSASAAPLFKQCPPIGHDSGCGTLIVVGPNGELSSSRDPSQPPFDGRDDTLIGVQNNSSSTFTKLILRGAGVFLLDGDGICSEENGPVLPGCPFGETGYEGPNTVIEPINLFEGEIRFLGGTIEPGKSAFFGVDRAIEELNCTSVACHVEEGEEPTEGTCTTVIGAGSLRKGAVKNILVVDDNLSTELARKPQGFYFHWNQGEHHLGLASLTSASCKTLETKTRRLTATFTGEGPARLDNVTGYHVAFTISTFMFSNTFKATNLKVVIRKGNEVVASFNHELSASDETYN